jgi:hypothetical protein
LVKPRPFRRNRLPQSLSVDDDPRAGLTEVIHHPEKLARIGRMQPNASM